MDVDEFEEYIFEYRQSLEEEGDYHPETIDAMVAQEIERLDVEADLAYERQKEEGVFDD